MPRWPIRAPGHKWCPRCERELPIADFSGGTRRDGYCRPCKAERVKEQRARQAGRPDPTAEARFWPKVDKRGPDECWLWKAAMGADGYPRFTYMGQMRHAHRVSAILAGIEVPANLDVDHLCRIRTCVNPAHMRVVTRRVNALENNDSPFARNARKTHCVRGHPLSGDNLSVYTITKKKTRYGRPTNTRHQTRACLACKRARYHRLKLAGAERTVGLPKEGS